MNKESASILTIVFSVSLFAAFIAAPTAKSDIPTEGLIGYWAFDEWEGDIAYDSVGANHGTIYGAEWTTGQVGGALLFNGVDSHVLLSANILNAAEPFSAFAWVRLDNKRGTKNQRILQQDWPGGRGLLYRNTETEKLGAFLGGEKTFSTQAIFQDTGQWYHLGVTHDSGTVKLYIDGQEDANNIVHAEPCTLGFIIGAPTNPSSTFGMWDGVIDEVMLYNRALTSQEVEQLYQAGAGGPIAHWKFDEGAGDIAYDSVGDNDGALVNGPSWTTGKVGGALEFDGVDEYVSLSSNAVTSTEFTVSGWANHYGPGGGVGESNFIFSQRDDPTGDNYSLIGLRADAAGYAGAGIRSSIGSHQKLRYPRKNYHEWHHYAMTVSTTDFVFYIDGAEVNRTSNNQQGDYVTSIDHVYIGRHVYSGQDRGYFNGLIDEVAVWDRALSGQEVEELYQAGAGESPELTDLEITGPDEVPDSNSAIYTAVAYYDDASTADVTTEAIWSVEPDMFANIDKNGLLTTQQLYAPEEIVWISAEYTEDEISLEADKEVVIFANCSIEELIMRDIMDAVQIKERVLEDLDAALVREKAAQDILRDMQDSRELGEWSFLQVVKARVRVLWAIIKQMWAKRKIEDSKDSLEDSLEILNNNDSQPAPPPNNGRGHGTGRLRRGR